MDAAYISKWILGIVGVLVTLLIVYIVKLLAGKADTGYIDAQLIGLKIDERLAAVKSDNDQAITAAKAINDQRFNARAAEVDNRFDKVQIQYKEDKKYLFDLITANKLILDGAVILLQKLDGLIGRESDKAASVVQSVTDVKIDVKQIVAELAKLAEKLDALPTRVLQLEADNRERARDERVKNEK